MVRIPCVLRGEIYHNAATYFLRALEQFLLGLRVELFLAHCYSSLVSARGLQLSSSVVYSPVGTHLEAAGSGSRHTRRPLPLRGIAGRW